MNDRNPGVNRELNHPLVGMTIGRYEIVDAIGMGAVGTVLKAHVVDTGQVVAVKLLPNDTDSTSAKRLETEARILSELDHPNIVKTIDFCIAPAGFQMMIIEYVDGKNLKEVIEKHVVLPVIRALGIFIQIADGMQFAHSKAVLHRDLKPHNVMLTTDPSDCVKILDFGIAKLTAENQNLTRPGEVLGSPIYMSPEQGRGLKLDERSDIYSLGVLMYQVLTGNFPHKGTSAAETMALKCSEPPPRFKEVAPGLVFPDSLECLVLRCLEPNRENRISSMRAVKTQLEEILLGLKDSSKPRALDEAGKSYAASHSTNRQSINGFISPKVRDAAENSTEKDDFRKSRRDSEEHRKRIAVRNAVILLVLMIVSVGGIVAAVSFLTKSNPQQKNPPPPRSNTVETKQLPSSHPLPLPVESDEPPEGGMSPLQQSKGRHRPSLRIEGEKPVTASDTTEDEGSSAASDEADGLMLKKTHGEQREKAQESQIRDGVQASRGIEQKQESPVTKAAAEPSPPDVQVLTIEVKPEKKQPATTKSRKSPARQQKAKKKASESKPQEPRRRRAYSTWQYYNER